MSSPRIRTSAAQLALFGGGDTPEGLRYTPEFVSTACEQRLIGQIEMLPLKPFEFGAFEGKRQVASFGWRYDYASHRLEPASEVPHWLLPLIRKVEASGPLAAGPVQQVLFTRYEPGAGIGWHRDKPHFENVFGLSLASACKFRFRRKEGTRWQRHTLRAEPRSLYLMTGPSRHVWQHSIPPVETIRYSITFRTMKAETPHAPR
jgi:alkylated DNA repair dioxygenase AlkB